MALLAPIQNFNIQHPTKANHSQPLPTAICTQRSSLQTPHINLLSIPSLSVMSLQTGSVISWHFPLAYSQSTINGRTGSNACTFIALVYVNYTLLHQNCQDPIIPLV